MERCPNCRARVNGAPECRRCGMDLRLLQATEHAANTFLQRALLHLAQGNHAAARTDLKNAQHLHRNPLVDRLLQARPGQGPRRLAMRETDLEMDATGNPLGTRTGNNP